MDEKRIERTDNLSVLTHFTMLPINVIESESETEIPQINSCILFRS